jgi:hypothetical protein
MYLKTTKINMVGNFVQDFSLVLLRKHILWFSETIRKTWLHILVTLLSNCHCENRTYYKRIYSNIRVFFCMIVPYLQSVIRMQTKSTNR